MVCECSTAYQLACLVLHVLTCVVCEYPVAEALEVPSPSEGAHLVLVSSPRTNKIASHEILICNTSKGLDKAIHPHTFADTLEHNFR